MNNRNKKKKQTGSAVWARDPSSHMHVACSACGFRIETSRALETGWSLSEITGVKYRFCPSCGKRMSAPS